MGRQDMIVGGYNVVKAALEPCVKGRDRRARLYVLMSSFCVWIDKGDAEWHAFKQLACGDYKGLVDKQSQNPKYRNLSICSRAW